MKPHTKLLALAAASLAALLPSAKAQLVTYETLPDYSGSTVIGHTSTSSTVGEGFTNVLAISSLTYNFFATGTTSATSLNAQFVEWTGAGNAPSPTNPLQANYTSLVDFGTISIPAFTGANQNGWTTFTDNNSASHNTYAYTFNFATLQLTDPTKTYALLLTNPTGSNTAIQLGQADKTLAASPFAWGAQLNNANSDYTFSQIVIVPNDGSHVVPVPEASTVAALVGGVLAVGLAVLRIRQRRQLAVAPVAA